jgi:hypothetical protein
MMRGKLMVILGEDEGHSLTSVYDPNTYYLNLDEIYEISKKVLGISD